MRNSFSLMLRREVRGETRQYGCQHTNCITATIASTIAAHALHRRQHRHSSYHPHACTHAANHAIIKPPRPALETCRQDFRPPSLPLAAWTCRLALAQYYTHSKHGRTHSTRTQSTAVESSPHAAPGSSPECWSSLLQVYMSKEPGERALFYPKEAHEYLQTCVDDTL